MTPMTGRQTERRQIRAHGGHVEIPSVWVALAYAATHGNEKAGVALAKLVLEASDEPATSAHREGVLTGKQR